jgi:hypothetical protein
LLSLHRRGCLAESADLQAICELPMRQGTLAQAPLRSTPALVVQGQAHAPAAAVRADAAAAAAPAPVRFLRLLQMTALPQC